MVFTAEQIASLLEGVVEGDKNMKVSSFAKIEEGQPGALSFLANPVYEKYIYETQSSVILINKDFELKQPTPATLIRVDDAYESIAKLMKLYQSMTERKTGISSLAYIDPTAKVGNDCMIAPFACIGAGVVIGNRCDIHPNVVIQENVTIGDDTVLNPNVTVYHDCKIGNRCVLHAGVVIGADGFGFAPTQDGYDKIPQLGIVEIADDVEIGANACVDRSTMGSTKVSKGVKLDNLVQVAHNVEIGEHTVISSQAGVAGSAKVGSWCMLGGQVGVAGHLTVGDRTHIGAQSGIAGGNLARKGGAVMMGYPAVDHRLFAKQTAALKSLPEMVLEFEKMKRELASLKEQLNKKDTNI